MADSCLFMRFRTLRRNSILARQAPPGVYRRDHGDLHPQGLPAGVASLIVALAINNGFRQDLQQRLLGSTSHVSLLRVRATVIQRLATMLERLSHQPHVVAAAPAIYEQVLISRGPRARGAVLEGDDPITTSVR